MAGMSGSSVADAAATAKVLVPAMVNSGYSKPFSAAITASSGTIAPVIPPSIGMVLYGAMTGTSIARLFLGGFIPGLLMATSLMSFSYVISRRRGYGVRGAAFSWRAVGAGLRESFLALLIPVVILGGIGAGIFTPTEAAAVAAVYAGIVGIFAYKEIRFTDLPSILSDAALGTAMIVFIMAAATPFGWIMAWERMPQAVTGWVVSTTSNHLVILMMLNALLLVLGCFMDSVAIMVITIPTLMPIIARIGVDPVQFGLILLINLMIGGLTPPYGILLFTVSAITRVPALEIAREALPFMGAILIVLALVTYVPSIVLFLPDLVMGPAK
jgi:C4-dicarboxylate transporter DctM subunit